MGKMGVTAAVIGGAAMCAAAVLVRNHLRNSSQCSPDDAVVMHAGLALEGGTKLEILIRDDNLSSHIPHKLIKNILLCLPVKLLLRFRCVSKPWRSLIDSKKFIKEYILRNIKCYHGFGLVVRALSQGELFYLADVDSLSDSAATGIVDPLKTYFSGAELVGSCNGLVCLWKNPSNIILWNPTTKKCRGVPGRGDLESHLGFVGSCVVGFGFDHLNDDYKVMRTVDSQWSGIKVFVYSLKRNSWTQAKTVPNKIRLITNNEICSNAKFGMHANVSLYWMAAEDLGDAYWHSKSRFLFAFDLAVETHRIVPFPAGVIKTDKNRMGLAVLNGSLCLIDHYVNSRTDIWLLNDNGVQNSWSKLLSVEQRGKLGKFKCLWPVAIWKTQNDVLLLVDKRKLVWYNRERNDVLDVQIHGFPNEFDILAYTESLARPTYRFKLDEKQVLKKSEEKKQKKQQKKENNMSNLVLRNKS